MRLLFHPHVIAAVVLAGTSDGWSKAEGERGSSKTPAQLQRDLLQARRARMEDEMVGILTKNQDAAAGTFPRKAHRDPRALAAARKPTCEVNGVEFEFVECTGDGAECKQKCLDACAGTDDCSCCVGGEDFYGYVNACDGFQGKVCPDGSCSGYEACADAKIGSVVDGCQGYQACWYAGSSGYIGRVVSSCNFGYGCVRAADNGGELPEISSSCNALSACWYAGYDGGYIGRIVSSCNYEGACGLAAGDGGEIQEISSSCNEDYACEFAASSSGYIAEITSSCNANLACFHAAMFGGEILEISYSCNDRYACDEAAISGYIKGLSLSCNARSACSSAAGAGIIPNKMERCCNSEGACEGLADDSQQDPDPDQCDAPSSRSPTKAPSKAPTPNPTEAPTKAPTSAPTKAPTSAATTINNAGKGCWGWCDKTAGDCAWCGTGQCCRAVDYRNQVPGCELARNARGARCGAWRGSGFPALMNVGRPCIGKCGKQPGDCDYCGTAGQCCRSFDGERCVPGCELVDRDSWSGPGSQCGEFKDPSAAPAHCT